MLAELDYSHIPNFQLIDDTYKNLSYDPENKYTVPYTWGTLGIIYNTTMCPSLLPAGTPCSIPSTPVRC